MTHTLDELVRAAAPVTDEQVRALTLDGLEADLRDAIVADRRPRRLRRGRQRLRRPLRLGLSGAAAAAVAGIALAMVLGGGSGDLGTSPGRAYAASAVRVANAVPRLLIGEPGWRVTRADEFRIGDGEMTFRSGSRTADLHWRSGPFRQWVDDRANSGDRLAPVEVRGTPATVFRYHGPWNEFTALWRDGRHTMEFRAGHMSLGEYRGLLRSLTEVEVNDWLAAMPPTVVLPVNAGRAVDEMLNGIPVPERFDATELKRSTVVRDRYQLGALVTGAVACRWIEEWVKARQTGDSRAEAEAVAAMRTSFRWPILREMQAKGDYPEVLWEFADAMAHGGSVPAGRPMTVEEGYRSALGC